MLVQLLFYARESPALFSSTIVGLIVMRVYILFIFKIELTCKNWQDYKSRAYKLHMIDRQSGPMDMDHISLIGSQSRPPISKSRCGDLWGQTANYLCTAYKYVLQDIFRGVLTLLYRLHGRAASV